MKSDALRYAELGYSVLPLHSIVDGVCTCHLKKSCQKPGKHPRTPHGVKDATTDHAQIEKWWSEHPISNIGIAMGRISNIVALDIDPRNGGIQTLNRLRKELGQINAMVRARTGGGGQHLIFKYPEQTLKSHTAGTLLGPGVDMISDGSILIVPPSRHKSGAKYGWKMGRSLLHQSPTNIPSNWLDRIAKNTSSAPELPHGMVCVAEGGRNNHLTSIAGKLQNSGLKSEAILAALLISNDSECVPPLSSQEVKTIVASVTEYPPKLAESDLGEHIAQLTLAQHFEDGKTLLFAQDNQFWAFDGRKWAVLKPGWLDGLILKTTKSTSQHLRKGKTTTGLVSQVRTLLQAETAVNDDRLRFLSEPLSVINCSNGELSIMNDGDLDFKPHRAESYLRQCLNVTYDPRAKCPEYDAALAGIFRESKSPKEMVRHWHELIGYLIQPRRDIPLIVILTGGGDNGKSVLMQTVVRLVGTELISAQRIENLDANRFAIANLLGKLVLLDDDVRSGVRLPDGELKKISEAKTVTGEYKHGSQFNFVVRSVPILLCNNTPSLADVSHGMLRRLMVVPFDRKFTDADKDVELFNRIWRKELSGVLNRSLEGLERLIQRNMQFDEPQALRAAKSEWITQANPLPAFIEEKCMRGDKCWINDFYPAFRDWSQKMGFTRIQQQPSVTKNLKNLGFEIKRGNKGNRIIGISLK